MPTQAINCQSAYEHTLFWTDDLPVCRQSGVGSSTNLLYREDGVRQEEHPCEDRSFHVRVNSQTFLYGVFDGHEGEEAAQFALQRMAYEILFGQLDGKTTDEEIKDVLRQAFSAVERSYMESIDDRLAERAKLQMQMDVPDDMNEYETYKKYPHLVERLKTLNCELSCGTTAVVALVYGGRLYVANVGESRALLCRTDKDGVLRVLQLSVDHNLSNEDELLRLLQLGLNIEKIKHERRLGNQENTRCLGNYLVKGGYKEQSELVAATSEPVIADPEIHGGILLDESCRFLMLMSDGVYKSLENATQTDQVNKVLAQMAVDEFRHQSTLTGVAQAVIDKIGRIHHDFFMSNNMRLEGDSTPGGVPTGRRDDMTLLIRNFNFDIPNALQSPSVRFNMDMALGDTTSCTGSASVTHLSDSTAVSRPTVASPSSTSTGLENSTTGTETPIPQTDDTTTTEGSTSDPSQASATPPAPIQPYVDFTEYYENVEQARLQGTLPIGIDF